MRGDQHTCDRLPSWSDDQILLISARRRALSISFQLLHEQLLHEAKSPNFWTVNLAVSLSIRGRRIAPCQLQQSDRDGERPNTRAVRFKLGALFLPGCRTLVQMIAKCREAVAPRTAPRQLRSSSSTSRRNFRGIGKGGFFVERQAWRREVRGQDQSATGPRKGDPAKGEVLQDVFIM